ncbi:VRR-NUC domain-containing protein [Cupriavidus sp. PET2-C1]
MRTTTKPEATGVVMPVTDPVDLWYLCEKCNYATKNPLYDKNGKPMYQRQTTRLVRKDAKNFGFEFPYQGEVGFDMTQSPPAAIMSKGETFRPSMFPLSKYSEIRRSYLAYSGIEAPTEFRVEDALVSKDELEDTLDPRVRNGKPVATGKKVNGLLRIPDVLRVQDFSKYGAAKYRQDNLEFVIEIKFPNDRFSDEQVDDYRKIAGNAHMTRLRLLETRVCSMRRRKERDWIRASKKEPVYKPASKAIEQAQQRNNNMLFFSEYQLLIGEIDSEHDQVRRVMQPAPIPPNTPVMKPISQQSIAEQMYREKQLRAMMEGALAAPFFVAAIFVAGAGTFGVAATGEVIGLVTSGETAAAAAGGAEALQTARIIPFARAIRPLVPGSAAAAMTEKLAAQVASQRFAPRETELDKKVLYLYWPD